MKVYKMNQRENSTFTAKYVFQFQHQNFMQDWFSLSGSTMYRACKNFPFSQNLKKQSSSMSSGFWRIQFHNSVSTGREDMETAGFRSKTTWDFFKLQHLMYCTNVFSSFTTHWSISRKMQPMVVSKDRQSLANTTEVPLDGVLLGSIRTCTLVCDKVSLGSVCGENSLESVGSETGVGFGSGWGYPTIVL